MTQEKKKGSLAKAWNSPEFWTEVAIGEFVSGLRRVMDGLKQKTLARRLEMSESAVSQILNGAEENYSLERMNRIAGAVGAAVHVCVANRDSIVRWQVEPTGPLGQLLPHEQLRTSESADTATEGKETVNQQQFAASGQETLEVTAATG